MKIDYDFIEIGTSDFDTLIQEADDLKIGLSIEPISKYLKALPNPAGVTKVNAAVSDKDGKIDIYYISDDKISEHGLPYYIRGCNSVDRPHNFSIKQIGEELYNELVTIEEVPTVSWTTLIETYNIGTIKYLKVDTEGHEFQILSSYFEACKKNPELYADKILFEYNENSNPEDIENMLNGLSNYEITRLRDDILLNKKSKVEKAYVLYSNEKYADIVTGAAKSIREFSQLPIIVYMLDSDRIIDCENTQTVKWNFDVSYDDNMYVERNMNFYVNRYSDSVYKILIQRPAIVKHALDNFAKTIAYVDSDSVATPNCDNIFNLYDCDLEFPWFVEGIHDYLKIDGRGGADSRDDLSTTLEHPACELFGVDQYIRWKYRQSGYFVAGQNTKWFLQEWSDMCHHEEVLKDFKLYAPFHEETLANVLLWKYKYLEGLPYIYVNGSLDAIEKTYIQFETTREVNDTWFRVPESEELVLFFHGEKNHKIMNDMVLEIKKYNKMETPIENSKIKILAFSDKNYEYQIDYLIQSLHLHGHSNIEFLYYTVGFDSDLQHPNLIKKPWPLDPNMKRFPFYKAGICLDAIRTFGGDILFLDSDIVISRRFNPNFFVHDLDYPLLSVGNWDLPYYYNTVDPNAQFPKFNLEDRVIANEDSRSTRHDFFISGITSSAFGNIKGINHDDQSYEILFDGKDFPIKVYENELENLSVKDYSRLMRYYGVRNPTMTYVYSCALSFNEKCEDFLLEWKSITENEYLNSFDREFYPIAEETAINVTLWRRNATQNYGRIFVNTLYADVVDYVESNSNIMNAHIFDNLLQKCEDSERVQFYHGMIDAGEIGRSIENIKSKK